MKISKLITYYLKDSSDYTYFTCCEKRTLKIVLCSSCYRVEGKERGKFILLLFSVICMCCVQSTTHVILEPFTWCRKVKTHYYREQLHSFPLRKHKKRSRKQGIMVKKTVCQKGFGVVGQTNLSFW